MKKRSIVIILVVLLIIAAIVFQLMRNKKKLDDSAKPKEVNTEQTIPVYTHKVQMDPLDQELIKVGTLIPSREADISAEMSGKLTSVNINLGSHVSQGSVVARIDNKQVYLNIEAAKLQRDQAKRDYDRYKALYEGDAAPEINYQNAQLQYESAVNQISILEKQLGDFNVKAPISGMVVTKLKESGEFVAPGAVIGQIVDVSSLKATVKVSERDVYTLRLGSAVRVTTDIYPEAKFDGKITFISAKGDAAHNYDVEVSIKNSAQYPLKAGTLVNVDFIKNSSESVLSIPRSALVESTKNPYVYVVENGAVVSRPVVLGREFGANIEILDGVKEGEEVVTSGQVNLKPGLKVRSVQQNAPIQSQDAAQ